MDSGNQPSSLCVKSSSQNVFPCSEGNGAEELPAEGAQGSSEARRQPKKGFFWGKKSTPKHLILVVSILG